MFQTLRGESSVARVTGAGDVAPSGAFRRGRRESEGGSMEGRLPGARGLWSSTGGWKPPLHRRRNVDRHVR